MDLPKKETESRQANEHALGVAFDADSRGDIRFCRYCGLRVVRSDYCCTASADSKNAVNSLFTVAPRAGMMT